MGGGLRLYTRRGGPARPRSRSGDGCGPAPPGLGLAEALAAEPLVGEHEALAIRARVSTRQAVATTGGVTAGHLRVTPREREILAQLVSGRTYGEIAKELVISEKTVSSHISNLLAKTGTSNRVEPAGYAERSHLSAG